MADTIDQLTTIAASLREELRAQSEAAQVGLAEIERGEGLSISEFRQCLDQMKAALPRL